MTLTAPIAALIQMPWRGLNGPNAGLIAALPTASAAPRASWADGFALQTMEAGGNAFPSGQDLNAVLNQMSQLLLWVNAGGQWPFNATLASEIGGYPLGAKLQLNDGITTVINTVAGNTQDPNAALTGWYVDDGTPTGTITVWPGSLANLPPGRLNCDGSSLLVAAFPRLFAVLGYTWGGSGANFNLPNFQERFPQGADATYPLGTTGGSAQALLNHTHTYTETNITGGTGGAGGNPSLPVQAGGVATGGPSIATTSTSLPPFNAVNFIIKA